MYLRLNWSPRRSDWQIVPGDSILESGAKPFYADWRHLVTRDSFLEVAAAYNWPAPPADFINQVKLAVRDARFGETDPASRYWLGDFANVIAMMLDAEIPLCECFYRIEKMRRGS